MPARRPLLSAAGARATRGLYATLVLGSFVMVLVIALRRPVALIALAALAAAVAPLRRVLGGAKGRDLVEALAATGMLQLAFGALLALGIVL